MAVFRRALMSLRRGGQRGDADDRTSARRHRGRRQSRCLSPRAGGIGFGETASVLRSDQSADAATAAHCAVGMGSDDTAAAVSLARQPASIGNGYLRTFYAKNRIASVLCCAKIIGHEWGRTSGGQEGTAL